MPTLKALNRNSFRFSLAVIHIQARLLAYHQPLSNVNSITSSTTGSFSLAQKSFFVRLSSEAKKEPVVDDVIKFASLIKNS
jgi:hypothetical protein